MYRSDICYRELVRKDGKCHSTRGLARPTGDLRLRLPIKRVCRMGWHQPPSCVQLLAGSSLQVALENHWIGSRGQKRGQLVNYAPCCPECQKCISVTATEWKLSTWHLAPSSLLSLGSQTPLKRLYSLLLQART